MTFCHDNFDELREYVQHKLSKGDTLDQAIDRVLSLGADLALYEPHLRAFFERRTLQIRNYRQVVSVAAEPGALAPYFGALPDDPTWSRVSTHIEQAIGAEAAKSVHLASDKIMETVGIPTGTAFDRRGLVVGFVQSGKTTSFLAVAAKAVDAGFTLIIVLTGTVESLRVQTQKRLDAHLIGSDRNSWHQLTTEDHDFDELDNAGSLLRSGNKLLAVVKKNSSVLKKLNRWIRSSGSVADQTKILVIDDEADQASINTNKDQDDPTAINGHIRTLLQNKQTAYVAYTATPFANILVDPNKQDDIYPRDFIHVLPEPKGYMGPKTIFGRDPLDDDAFEKVDSTGLDVIRVIGEEEAGSVRPKRSSQVDGTCGPALAEAIRWFLLATAARRERSTVVKHSSMLVHTDMRTDFHTAIADLTRVYVNDLKSQLDRPELKAAFAAQWESEVARVQTDDSTAVDFDVLWDHVRSALNDTEIIVDNSASDDRLVYLTSEPRTVIAIGGNTLSRGLTLEGLVASYFVRPSRTYDTLLQMGRWFGFRTGYTDLPRVWMPEELIQHFHDLATIETELRRELARCADEGLTPEQFQAPIRLHKDMLPTASNKQRAAVSAGMTYSRARVQTFLFPDNRDILQRNLDLGRSLAETLVGGGYDSFRRKNNGSLVFRDVEAAVILDFLDSYEFHPNSTFVHNDMNLVTPYVLEELKSGSLKRWNISFLSRSTADSPVVENFPFRLNKINRAGWIGARPGTLNIRALVGSIDRLNDREGDDSTEQLLKEARKLPYQLETSLDLLHDRHVGKGIGHLTVSVVDKDSQPKNTANRIPLNAPVDLLGVGLFLPAAKTERNKSNYISAPQYRGESVNDEDSIAVYDEVESGES